MNLLMLILEHARDQNINWANLYENEMVLTYHDANCLGASLIGVTGPLGFPSGSNNEVGI